MSEYDKQRDIDAEGQRAAIYHNKPRAEARGKSEESAMRSAATGLVWTTSVHLDGREVASSGKVQIGGVYPPFAEATTWRWRMWMNGESVAANGSAESSAAAKKHVEWHWAEFMHRAGLTPKIAKGAADG